MTERTRATPTSHSPETDKCQPADDVFCRCQQPAVSQKPQVLLLLSRDWQLAGGTTQHVQFVSYKQGPRFFAANFAKFYGTIYEIPRHYYSQIPYILQPVGVGVLTDNNSKYKEVIVTCNTKTHYIRPLTMKIHVITLVIIIKVSLQRLDFIVL